MSTRRNSRQTARRPGSRPRRYTPYSLYRRALRLEPLEDRRLLAVVTVNTLSDTVDFNDGLTSLREAIFATNTVGGADTINFAPALTFNGPATIVLTQGELKITDSLAITGPGANLLTIDASGSDPTPALDNGDGARVFRIDDGASELRSVAVADLTLTGGDTSAGTIQDNGGAILSRERLQLVRSRISGNASRFGGGVLSTGDLTIVDSILDENHSQFYGGAVWVSGTARIAGSDLSRNRAAASYIIGNRGGALYATRANVQVSDTTISGNVAGHGGGLAFLSSKATLTDVRILGNTTDYSGGGILAGSTELSISSSTISDNLTHGVGGGINASSGDRNSVITITDSLISNNIADGGAGGIRMGNILFTLANSTITGNSTQESGGGLDFFGSRMNIQHSTITKNIANSNGGSLGDGGGIAVIGRSAAGFPSELNLDHAIVADNRSYMSASPDIYFVPEVRVALTSQYSLVGYATGSSLIETPPTLPDGNGNLIGGPVNGTIDPKLGPLADNGGPTKTHALLAGSPAINAGDLSLVAGVNGVPQFDQRGTPFGRVFNGRIDIGAFEYQTPSDLNLVVDTLVDESDGNYSRGDLSLREAILLANTYAGPNYPNVVDTIRFDPALTAIGPAKILLTKGELKISSSVVIIGLGSGLLTVDASGNDATPTVKDGKGSRIFNIGATPPILNVSISGLTLTGGDSSQSGGAILNSAANLTLDDVAIRNNKTLEAGGGLASYGGNLVIRHSTIADNVATGSGGGIRATNGNLTISDSTISGNVLTGDRGAGGGVYFDGSLSTSGRRLEITRSKILNNSAKAVGGGVFANQGTMEVVDSEIAANKLLATSGTQGGGVFLFSAVVATIETSKIHDNAVSSSGAGGGIALSAGSFSSLQALTISSSSVTSNFGGREGGGIYSAAVLHVDNTTIAGNSTQGSIGGGGITNYGKGAVYVNHSTISENLGSGIRQLGTSLTLIDSIISGNSTNQSGGGVFAHNESTSVTITRTQIVRNSAALQGGGIAIFHNDGTTTVLDSTISNNLAGRQGGGIFLADGNAEISRSTVEGNTAGDSGGGLSAISADLLEISASTLNANTAKVNGGAINAYGPIRVLTSTISGNSADALGGGVWAGTAEFVNSTIFQNRASVAGGGVFISAGTLTLTHTIVASDVAPAGQDVTGLLGATITAKYSFIGSNAGSGLAQTPFEGPADGNGNIIGGFIGYIDPMLGPLSMNGGPTAVHVPLPGSPVINAGDPAVTGQADSDQRGEPFVRVSGGRIDMGSVEVQPLPLLGDFDQSGIVDASDYALWRKTKGSSTDLRADGNGDRLVNDADYAIWRAHFGETRPIVVGPIFVSAAGASVGARETEDLAASVAEGGRDVVQSSPLVVNKALWLASSADASVAKRSLAGRIETLDSPDDASAGLLAWLSSKIGGTKSVQLQLVEPHGQNGMPVAASDLCDPFAPAVDEVFARFSRHFAVRK